MSNGVARIDDTTIDGILVPSQDKVYCDSKQVIRQEDSDGNGTVVVGSTKVFIMGKGVARLNDELTCGATINQASTKVFSN